MKRICPLCHREFITKASRAKYCLDCRPLALKEVKHRNYLRWKAKGTKQEYNPERAHYYYLKDKERIVNGLDYKTRKQARTRKYRERLKADPKKWAEYLRKNRERENYRRRTDPNYRAKRLQIEREYRCRKRLEKLQEKTCVICGVKFSTVRNDIVTCGNRECRRKRHVEMTIANRRLHRKERKDNEKRMEEA